MNKLIKFLFLFLVSQSWAISLLAQPTFPTTKLLNLQGDTIIFNQQIDTTKITMLKFWSAWGADHCVPCSHDLKNLWKKYQQLQLNDASIQLLTISTDKGSNLQEMVTKFMNKHGLHFDVLLDTEDKLQQELEIYTLPTLLIFDPKGQQVYESGVTKKSWYEVLAELTTPTANHQKAYPTPSPK